MWCFVSHLINTSKNSFPTPDIVFAQIDNKSMIPHNGPIVRDNHLAVELVANGINFPVSMSFLDSDDILVTEKNTGMVKRILNGVIIKEPLLSVNVVSSWEGGLLGIAIDKDTVASNPTYVYLYYSTPIREEREMTI